MVEPSAFPPFTRTAVSERAADLLPEYRAAIADIPPEAGFGGIWESEMFLFYAAVRPCAPKQILEPGRARGKSTLILACCFPNARIISVEFESHSPNATVAEAKLKPCQNLEGQNVEVWYGDSRKILPERLKLATPSRRNRRRARVDVDLWKKPDREQKSNPGCLAIRIGPLREWSMELS
jgi:hypothetical protein